MWHTGDYLDIELIPIIIVISRRVPVCEERGDCALFVRGLHSRHKLAVSELLMGGDRTASESIRSLGHSSHSY